MYGLANIAENSFQFIDCLFSENYGKSNTIHLLLSSGVFTNCDFSNNYAKHVTHGFTLISSNLVIRKSIIHFEKHCYWFIANVNNRIQFAKNCDDANDFFARQLDLSKLDTGFFNLYLTSNALISEDTVI